MTESFVISTEAEGSLLEFLFSLRILDFISLRSKWQRVLSSRPKRRDLFWNFYLVWEFSTSFRYARNDREFLSSRPKWRDLFWNFYLVWDFSASLRYARNDREFCHLNRSGEISFGMLSLRILDFISLRSKWQRVLSSRPKRRDLFWIV